MSSAISFERDAGLITPGQHYFRITSVEEKIGPKGPYFMWYLTVEERSPDNTKTGIFVTSLSPAARFKMVEFLDAVGAPETGSGTPEQFVGFMIRGNVIHEEREGKMQHTIETVLPSGLPASATVAAPQVAAPPPTAPVEHAPAPDLLAGDSATLPSPPEAPAPPTAPDDSVPF